MVPKSQRLRKQARFQQFSAAARTPLFQVKTAANNQEHNRYTVIVPTTAARRAVQRNRIRRAVYAAVRGWPPAGQDIVFFIGPTTKGTTTTEIQNQIETVRHRMFGNR